MRTAMGRSTSAAGEEDIEQMFFSSTNENGHATLNRYSVAAVIRTLTVSGFVAGLLVASLSGCAARKSEVTELLWPAPPLTPRIKFVGVLRNQEDLGKSTSELFADALLGKRLPESLQQPMGVAPTADGKRLYVTDYAKPGVFVFDFESRKMLPFAADDPQGFATPLGIALDSNGDVYIVDSSPRVIRVFDAQGKFLRNITDDSLERPTGIAVDSVRRRLYVADSSKSDSPNHVVRVFDLDGTYIKAFGGQGYEDGKMFFPTYLALDAEGNIYVADTMNARVQAFDPEGNYLKKFGERGDAYGMFDKPKGVAVDTFGNLYVVDSAWSNVQIFNQHGDVLLFFGARGRFPGLLFNPTGLAMDPRNRIYVADAFNKRVTIYQLVNTTAADSFLDPSTEQVKSGGGSENAVPPAPPSEQAQPAGPVAADPPAEKADAREIRKIDEPVNAAGSVVTTAAAVLQYALEVERELDTYQGAPAGRAGVAQVEQDVAARGVSTVASLLELEREFGQHHGNGAVRAPGASAGEGG